MAKPKTLSVGDVEVDVVVVVVVVVVEPSNPTN